MSADILGGGEATESYGNPMHSVRKAPRCHAKAKSTGMPCNAPAVRGWSVCRMHGAKGGAPPWPRQRDVAAWRAKRRDDADPTTRSGTGPHGARCPWSGSSRDRLGAFIDTASKRQRGGVKVNSWPTDATGPIAWPPCHKPQQSRIRPLRRSPSVLLLWGSLWGQALKARFYSMISRMNGGETGIRTLGRRKPTTVFETAAFDHSATSPR